MCQKYKQLPDFDTFAMTHLKIMKTLKLFFTLALLGMMFTSNAQTLLPSNLPNAGDFLFEFIDNNPDTSALTITSPGLNQIWDYATSINIEDSSAQFFSNPSQIPFQFSTYFPNAEFGIFSFTDSVAYPLISNATGFYMQGVLSLASSSPFDTINFVGGQCLMAAPLSPGSQVDHSFSFVYPAIYDSGLQANISIHRTTYQFFEVDASGTFNGPAGIFYDCLRVKQTRVSADTLYFDFVDSLLNDTIIVFFPTDTVISYSWVRNGTPYLVAEFEVEPNTNNVTRAKVFNGSGILTGLAKKQNDVFSCFPNPATSVITLESPLNNDLGSLSIFDLCGKKIATHTIVSGTNHLSLDNIPSGCYQMLITGNRGEVYRQKLQVIK
jgi:hypothetical protein